MLSRTSDVSSVAPHPPHLVKQFEPQPGLETQEHAHESPVAMEQREARTGQAAAGQVLSQGRPQTAMLLQCSRGYSHPQRLLLVLSLAHQPCRCMLAAGGSPACATGVGGLSSA
jgi:hypothetical protein